MTLRTLKVLASLLIIGCVARGATDDQARLPVIVGSAYPNQASGSLVSAISRTDAAAKASTGRGRLMRLYQGVVAGPDTGKYYATIEADSFADITAATNLAHKLLARETADAAFFTWHGGSVALKAEYYEGDYDGEWVYLTFAHVTNDPAYLQAMRDGRVLFDAHGLKDIKINLYKVSLGRSEVTHEVAICAPTEERIHALMDAMSAPWIAGWLSSLPKMRSIVSNGLYHDIVP
ncbi:MAG TPA: hypothetical protein VGG34_05070 [Opitutaceae bacterium]|jgi:hypothetical protein